MTLKQTNVLTLTDKDLRRRAEQAYATLSPDGTVPDEQVPGQVTDVLNYETKNDFPVPGDPRRYYRSDASGKTYKWDEESSEYVEVVVPTAAVTSVADKTGAVTLDKSDVGLANVVNTGDSATPVEGGTTKFTTGGAFTELAKKADKSEMSVVAGEGADADKTTITLKSGTSATVLTAHQDVSGKADKAADATAGHYATLDASGNLVDSGKGVDTTVTADSANLVTSGAVDTAIKAIDVSSQLVGKLDSAGQAPDFAVSTAYSADHIVRYEGNLYRCIAAVSADNTAKPDADTTHWAKVKLSTDVLTSIKFTAADGALTMADVLARLDTINAQGQHVFFDVSAISSVPQLYLVTIFIDTTANVVRVYDQVTGKIFLGTYDATATLAETLAKAVDSYVSITVTAATLDGVTVTGQTVYLYEGDSADATRLKQTAAYEGQPVTFTVARGFEYFITVSSTLANHFSPSTAHGSANAATSVTLTYQDTSNITTFAGLQGFLASVEADETLTSDAERIAFVESALLPGTNADSQMSNRKAALEIADTWIDNNGVTSYSNPMVVMSAGYFEEAPAEFNSSLTYAVNDRVLYKGISYTCSVAKTSADALTPPEDMYNGSIGHWTVTANDATPLTKHLGVKLARKWCTAGFQFDANETVVLCDSTEEPNAAANMGYYGWAKAFDSSAAYTVNAYCSYSGVAYKCTTAIAAGEATDTPDNDTAHWTVQSDMVKSGLVLLSNTTYPAGSALPYSGWLAIYKNGVRDSSKNIFSCGYNNWERSGVRQYLNSSGAANSWWVADHVGDVKPSQATDWRGYLAGCSASLLAAIKKVKVTTARNTASDGGSYRATYDTFFLPSGTELYGSANANEGTADLYWKQATGLSSASNNNNAGRIHYLQSNHASSSTVWLRSPNTGTSSNVWHCNSNGNLNISYNYNANGSYGLAPACVIY